MFRFLLGLFFFISGSVYADLALFDYKCYLVNDDTQLLRVLFYRDSNSTPKTMPEFIDEYAIAWMESDGWPKVGLLKGRAMFKISQFQNNYQLRFESLGRKVVLNENSINGRAVGFIEENGERIPIRCSLKY